MEHESQECEYSAMVSERFQMLLCICKGSHRSGCAVHQSRVRELGRVSVVRLVKEPPFSVLVVNGDTFQAGPAWRDGNTLFTCAAKAIRITSTW